MKKLIVIFALVAVVLVSGCTNQETTISTDNGILITQFSADPSEVEENEFVNFILNVQNVGGVDATDVVAELGGVQNMWRDVNGAPIPGLYQAWQGQNVLLEAPNEMYSQPGETRQQVWTLKTPVVGEGVTLPSIVTAYVTFDYATTGSITLKAVSKDVYRVMQGKGEAISNPLITVNSAGPIKIYVDQIAAPWVVDPTRFSAFPETSSFLVKFANVGDGFPYTAPSPQDGRQLGQLEGRFTIYGPASFNDCLGYTQTKQFVIDRFNPKIDWIKLSKSAGESPVGCTIEIDPTLWPPTQDEATIRIDFELTYRYYVKADTTVNVRGLSRVTEQYSR